MDRKGEDRVFLVGFPLLIIPFAIYNMVAFLTPGVAWSDRVTSVHMLSGQDWTMTAGDLLIIVALVVLFVEIIKATRAGMKSVIDHGLSTLIFVAALVEFLVVRQAATSVFAILLAISLVDVIGGYSVSIRTAQRDYTVERLDQ